MRVLNSFSESFVIHLKYVNFSGRLLGIVGVQGFAADIFLTRVFITAESWNQNQLCYPFYLSYIFKLRPFPWITHRIRKESYPQRFLEEYIPCWNDDSDRLYEEFSLKEDHYVGKGLLHSLDEARK